MRRGCGEITEEQNKSEKNIYKKKKKKKKVNNLNIFY